MEQEQSKTTGIQFGMDFETNKLLEKSAKASKRTKKAEAAIRLADHVRRFPPVNQINTLNFEERKIEDLEHR